MSTSEGETDPVVRELLSTTDAMVWAERWCEIARDIAVREGDAAALIDAGWMVGWFANAMAAQQMSDSADELTRETERLGLYEQVGAFRSRPSSIDAIRWNGQNFDAVRQWLGTTHDEQIKAKLAPSEDGSRYDLKLLAGKHGAQEYVPVPVGHWVVSQPGDRSDVWPVDHDYFITKYEPVGE